MEIRALEALISSIQAFFLALNFKYDEIQKTYFGGIYSFVVFFN